MGFQKSYVIIRVGHDKCLRLLTRWVGGVKKGQKHAYVIFEWSLTKPHKIIVNTFSKIGPRGGRRGPFLARKSAFFYATPI